MQRPLTFDFRLGLIGYPLGHSLSPKIQSAALKASGLDGSYSLFPIAPDDKQGLKDLLARVRCSNQRQQLVRTRNSVWQRRIEPWKLLTLAHC